LLDVDGTIVDIASAPHLVVVSDELRRTLSRLVDLTAGAVALASGRPVSDLDRLFAPLRLSAIGGHGAEIRIGAVTVNRGVAQLPEGLRRLLSDIPLPGLLTEDKGYSLAVHYRGAPELKAQVEQSIAEACATYPGEALEVMPGKLMLEIKRPGVNKGEAVQALMTHAPFAGRVPVFIGDDVTDDSVFAVLPQLGGIGFSVERPCAGLAGVFDCAAQVRAALAALAEQAA
jgi:trehalose 6-phosphate phosphatase